MRLTNLLSFRLFIFIFFILTVLTVGFSLYYIQMESAQYEEIARQCANRTSSLVAGSTRNAMLLNQKEKAFEIINDLVKQEGIEKICLYNCRAVCVGRLCILSLPRLCTDPRGCSAGYRAKNLLHPMATHTYQC